MKTIDRKITVIALAVLACGITNCSAGNSTGSSGGALSDTSASGAAAGAVGGALSGSESNGSQAFMQLRSSDSFFASLSRSVQRQLSPMPQAFADSLCPTFHSMASDCSTSGGGNMWLTYSDCTFTGIASWNGVQELSMSNGTAACGAFPNPTSATSNEVLYRQFVAAASGSVAGSITLSAGGYTATVDDATANLGNFDGDTIAPVSVNNSGYGSAVTFNTSGARTGLTIGQHISVPGVFDHSITGDLTVTETAGATERTVNGQIEVYHNLLKIIGTSTFTNVVHEDTCCLPVSGTISTTFSQGAHVLPTALGYLALGKTETLTFTGCGTATLQTYEGATLNVTLDRCF